LPRYAGWGSWLAQHAHRLRMRPAASTPSPPSNSSVGPLPSRCIAAPRPIIACRAGRRSPLCGSRSSSGVMNAARFAHFARCPAGVCWTRPHGHGHGSRGTLDATRAAPPRSQRRHAPVRSRSCVGLCRAVRHLVSTLPGTRATLARAVDVSVLRLGRMLRRLPEPARQSPLRGDRPPRRRRLSARLTPTVVLCPPPRSLSWAAARIAGKDQQLHQGGLQRPTGMELATRDVAERSRPQCWLRQAARPARRARRRSVRDRAGSGRSISCARGGDASAGWCHG
jgi:hypothetical protein